MYEDSGNTIGETRTSDFKTPGGNKDELIIDLLHKTTEDYEVDLEEVNESWWGIFKVKMNRNLNMLTRKRLTTDLKGNPIGASMTPMHKDNIRRLKNAYRHPFQKIPADYFEFKKARNSKINA